MMRKRGLFLSLGVLWAGCGSSNGGAPDAGVPHDGAVDPAADLVQTGDISVAGDSFSPDTLIAIDVASLDSAAAADLSGVDTGALEGGHAEAGSGTVFVATFSGAQEVPPVATSASGSATFTLSSDHTHLTYHIAHNVVGGTASHIHLGAAGENGAVIHPIVPFDTEMSGTLTLSAGDADNLERGMLYINVHSATNPGGEIRAQILHPGDSLWVAKLMGEQETPPVASTGTGSAALILDSAKTSLRYHVKTTGLTLTGAHIHKGIATVAGGVLFPLSPLGSTMDGTLAVTSANVQDLADGDLYVNVHTLAYPSGELRGQLLQPGEVLYAAVLTGAKEVPPVDTLATGGAEFILNSAGTALRYAVVFSNLTATASHIHSGAAGSNGPVIYPLTLTATGAKGTQTVNAADVTNLNAGAYYVNAHTAAKPGGEIRGQIAKQ